MRVIENINITNIKIDNHSISERTLAIVDFIRKGGIVPPIKVQFKDGTFMIKDGRHRITAYKLLGLKQIKCKYFKKL